MKVNLKQATEMVELYIKAGLVPFMHSSPAIGKSDAVRSIANKYNLELIDFRLSQSDPTDLNGLISFKDGKSTYMPMSTFPLESDPLPEGKSGWLLFLDEMNSAPRAVQAASYRLVLDRQVGQFNLHKKVAIVCAGNLDTDNAIVEDMSTALQSRLCHIEIEPHLHTWLDWAYENNVHYMITSYLQFQPSNLYNFNPNHSDKTFAAPRTWGFANKVLKVTNDKKVLLPMLAGTIGEGVAREFISFMSIEEQLPKIKEILNNPESAPMPKEPSILFALSGSVAEYTNSADINKTIIYIKRMPIEHQVVCLRRIIKKDKTMIANPAITQWLTENRNELF